MNRYTTLGTGGSTFAAGAAGGAAMTYHKRRVGTIARRRMNMKKPSAGDLGGRVRGAKRKAVKV
jgi:hypothetical protein